YISFLCSRREARCFCSISLKTEIDKFCKQHKMTQLQQQSIIEGNQRHEVDIFNENIYYAFWRLGSNPSKWNPEDASRQCIIPTRDIDSNVEPNGPG
ncbi:hypothetical protein MKW92_040509, partial [Papaver armeniacum]